MAERTDATLEHYRRQGQEWRIKPLACTRQEMELAQQMHDLQKQKRELAKSAEDLAKKLAELEKRRDDLAAKQTRLVELRKRLTMSADEEKANKDKAAQMQKQVEDLLRRKA